MRKFILSVAAIAVLAMAVPFTAPAQADAIIVGGHHHHSWHHDHDRTVIIKHRD
jgi:hypothetical protein